MRACTIKDCTNRHLARGMCYVHYQEWYLKNMRPTLKNRPTEDFEEIRKRSFEEYEKWRLTAQPFKIDGEEV